ncbi:14-3-3-like protein [Mercenaria mercenaria]|uniref:14-3-3-like protein n=1 Tax=Mercenaria mercenaria TaxID=6596 RepID=UPI00234EAF6F|nr:14-3-3-like protein [Mercenaria mercenaria]
MSNSRAANKMKAKICEQAERYDDMVKEMKDLIQGSDKTDDPLDEEERNLLSVAYKNVVGQRRAAWRVLSAKLESPDMNEKHRELTEGMKKSVENELNGLCKEVLKLLNENLIPNPENVPAKIFYLKMKGDYYRYMVEICGESPSREDSVKKAESAYDEAFKIAKEKLPQSSPIRLGLALNYSVFFYEIKDSPKEACELARSEFDEAMNVIEDAKEEVYKDSTLIMQLLRDNLTLWQSEREADDQDD